nr:MAG TPA: hypothetical protein [Caudoviricetes sp.]
MVEFDFKNGDGFWRVLEGGLNCGLTRLLFLLKPHKECGGKG